MTVWANSITAGIRFWNAREDEKLPSLWIHPSLAVSCYFLLLLFHNISQYI